MSNLTDHVLRLHGWAALVVIFLVPALESSAFAGFIFPGEIAVLLGGVLAFQGKVGLPAAIGVAVAGAVVGDSVGYEIGRHYGRRLLEGTIGRFVKHEHIDKAEHYLATKGGKAVFFGRFTAALRVLIPGLAGMARMRYRTFLGYNLAGGAIWATGFVLLGYAGGSSYQRVEAVAKKASLLLLLAFILVVAIIIVARRVAGSRDRLQAFAQRQLARPRVTRMAERYQAQISFLSRRFRREEVLGLTLTASLLAITLLGWAFGAVVQDVVAGESLNTVDRPVLQFFVSHREPWLTSLNKIVTALGSSQTIVPLAVVVGLAWWLLHRTWRPLVMLLSSYGGAEVLFRVLKRLIGRPRPLTSQAAIRFSGSAFPSGHATIAAAFWGMLSVLLAAQMTSWNRKVATWATAVVVVVMIGTSRLYLGAHWFTDVAGGWALGALWLFSLLTAVRTIIMHRSSHQPDLALQDENHE